MTNIEENIQIISKKGQPAFVVLPHADWLKIRKALAQQDDVQAYDTAKRDWERTGRQTYPAAIARQLASGTHPVAVFRTWRGLSQKQLADKTGLNVQSISHIETGVRKGGICSLRKIAKALDVSIETLSD